MKKQLRNLRIELSPKGVFYVDHQKRQRVSAAILCEGIGTRSDKTKVAEICFETFDRERLCETFNLSDFLPRNRHVVVERLANKGYRWPADKQTTDAILAAIAEKSSERRFNLVGAPGWYEEVFVTPDYEYSAKKSRRRSFLIDGQTGANIAPFRLGSGSLKAWKKNVAKVATKSSRMRLCIAAAIAAPLLRPLNMDSFGLNLYSDTSTGKTSCLVAAASVPGFIGEQGLPGWADSSPAIDQLLVGHRDSIMLLDETGDGEDKKSLVDRARFLAFGIGRNRLRNLDKKYEKSSNVTTRDRRNIVLSSSERALGQVAITEGKPRLGGEEVRLIDVPATDEGSQGIFDKPIKCKKSRTPVEQGKRLVDRVRQQAEISQGLALRKFLRKFTKDSKAVIKLQQYISDFETQPSAAMVHNADHRIRSNFGIIYAAAALAIDYEVLPWGKKQTLNAINKCMTAALKAKSQLADPPVSPVSIRIVASKLKEQLDCLDLETIPEKRARASADEARRREHAQGFREGQKLYVKPGCWNGITAQNRSVLIEHGILETERPDTPTKARKISGVKGKLRYFVINAEALDKALFDETSVRKVED